MSDVTHFFWPAQNSQCQRVNQSHVCSICFVALIVQAAAGSSSIIAAMLATLIVHWSDGRHGDVPCRSTITNVSRGAIRNFIDDSCNYQKQKKSDWKAESMEDWQAMDDEEFAKDLAELDRIYPGGVQFPSASPPTPPPPPTWTMPPRPPPAVVPPPDGGQVKIEPDDVRPAVPAWLVQPKVGGQVTLEADDVGPAVPPPQAWLVPPPAGGQAELEADDVGPAPQAWLVPLVGK